MNSDLESSAWEYERFVSLLAQYQREEITQVARVVEQKLETLVAEVTAKGGAIKSLVRP